MLWCRVGKSDMKASGGEKGINSRDEMQRCKDVKTQMQKEISSPGKKEKRMG